MSGLKKKSDRFDHFLGANNSTKVTRRCQKVKILFMVGKYALFWSSEHAQIFPNPRIFANFDATVLCDYWVDSKKFGTFSYLRVEQNPKMSSTRRWRVDGTSNIRRSKSLPGGRRKDASTQQFHKARSPQLLGRFWYFLVFSVSTFPHVHNHVNGSLMERQWTVNQPSNRSI